VTENNGYELALIATTGGQIKNLKKRNSDRSMVDSFEVSKVFWERLKPYVPETFKHFRGEAKAVGINERLKFLRYDEGQYFKPHNDGAYHRFGSNPPEESKITVQFYLNEGFKGGETTFVGSDKNGKLHQNNVPIVPKMGSALLFV